MPLLAAAVLAWLLAAVPARADHSVVEHVSQGAIAGNGAVNTEFRGASRDGSVVLFQTTEQLAAADTDPAADLYRRVGGVTELVTAGPASTGPNVPSLAGMTPDGGAVFFYTRDALVSADTDTSDDAYMYRAGTTTLLSFGGTPGCFSSQAYPLAWSDDASKVFFQSTDRHSAADTDCDTDLYEYSAGTVSIVHAGPSNTSILDASADGGKVFFTSADPIDPLDTDATNDVYMRDGTAFTQISTGGNGPFNAFATFGGWASPTGDRVYFRTFEQLAAEDTDTAIDTYLWHAGAVELVTAGPAGGNSGADAQVFAFSADGSHTFFSTAEPLVAGDTDASYDLYERSGGTTSLLSTGPAGGNGAFDANQLQHGVSGTVTGCSS
jgi:hypothetical protein